MATKTIEVNRDIRAEHLAAANEFRHKMAEQGTLVVRLISSPGSGKTMLLEKTAESLGRSHAVGVLVGDVETDRDAKRLAPLCADGANHDRRGVPLGDPVGRACLSEIEETATRFLFIEDVGNLDLPGIARPGRTPARASAQHDRRGRQTRQIS